MQHKYAPGWRLLCGRRVLYETVSQHPLQFWRLRHNDSAWSSLKTYHWSLETSHRSPETATRYCELLQRLRDCHTVLLHVPYNRPMNRGSWGLFTCLFTSMQGCHASKTPTSQTAVYQTKNFCKPTAQNNPQLLPVCISELDVFCNEKLGSTPP